jgi:hypothetical protein
LQTDLRHFIAKVQAGASAIRAVLLRRPFHFMDRLAKAGGFIR